MANGNGITPNAKRLLWCLVLWPSWPKEWDCSIRGCILGDWMKQFHFTLSDLGKITGGGLTGFGIIILFSAAIAGLDRLWTD